MFTHVEQGLNTFKFSWYTTLQSVEFNFSHTWPNGLCCTTSACKPCKDCLIRLYHLSIQYHNIIVWTLGKWWVIINLCTISFIALQITQTCEVTKFSSFICYRFNVYAPLSTSAHIKYKNQWSKN